jgi:hypothetical protein
MNLEKLARKILQANEGEIDPVMKAIGADVNAAQKKHNLSDEDLGKLNNYVWKQLQEYFVCY